MTSLFLILVVLFLFFVFGAASSGENQKPDKPVRETGFYKVYNDKGFALVCDLEKHFFANTVPSNYYVREYYQTFGIELAERFSLNDLYNQIGLEGCSDFDENTLGYQAKQHIFDLQVLTLSGRHKAATSNHFEVMSSEEVEDEYGINLYNEEVLVKVFRKMCWKEEKTRTTGVTYGGVRMSGKGAFKAVFGSMSVVPHTETSYEVVDYGDLYLTNKRLIFIGDENKNRSIRLDRILNTDLFEDGVLIGKENGTSPLLHWPNWVRQPEHLRWTQWTRREAGEFMIYLNRVMFQDVELRVKELA